MDSSIARVHQHAATLPRGHRGGRPNHKDPGREPPDREIGRSRDGLTTKIHLACDSQGRPLSLWLTGGNVNDSTERGAVLAGIRFRVSVQAGRAPGRTDCAATRATAREATGRCWPPARLRPPSLEKDDQAGHRQRGSSVGRDPPTPSVPGATSGATWSNAASTGSNTGADSSPDTTRPPCATSAASPWPPCRCRPNHDHPSRRLHHGDAT